MELEEKERLQKLLLEPAVFRELYKEDTKLQLLAFWRAAADYDVAGTLYVQEFSKWVAANEVVTNIDMIKQFKMKKSLKFCTIVIYSFVVFNNIGGLKHPGT